MDGAFRRASPLPGLICVMKIVLPTSNDFELAKEKFTTNVK